MNKTKEHVTAVFDEVAASGAWESLYKQDIDSGDIDKTNYNFLARRRAVGDLLVPYMKGDVIDIGCGSGDLVTLFSGKVKSYIGVDISANMIERAKAIYGASQGHKNVKFDVGDCEKLNFKDQAFDITSSVAVIEYLPDPSKSLDEQARLTKSGGYALVTIVHKYNLDRYLRLLARPFFPIYAWLRKRPLKSMRSVKHHVYSEGELDIMMQQRGFSKVGGRYTNFHVIPFPLDILIPSQYVKFSEKIDRAGKGGRYKLFASTYSGLYVKK